MKKVIITILIMAFLIPGLFIIAKFTVPTKKVPPRRVPPTTGTASSNNEQPIKNQNSETLPNSEVISGPQLHPVDEASQNESFKRFREELAVAIKNKDLDFLKQHLEKNIKYSFGADSGINGFLQAWNLDKDPEHSLFWVELEKVITLGGTFDSRNAFVAPYVFSKFPESVDAFTHVAVIEKNVKLYSNPDIQSKVIGVVNYNIIQVNEFRQDKSWQKVSVTKDVVGYVQTKYLRSPIDYRTYFENKGGSWQMVFFVAGD